MKLELISDLVPVNIVSQVLLYFGVMYYEKKKLICHMVHKRITQYVSGITFQLS